MASKIQIRRDTASNWTSVNPTLSNGELGLETDTKKLKAGDGSTAWTSLAYYTLATAGYAAYADATANFTGTLQKSGAAVLTSGGALGTPSGGTLTNATGLPPAGVTGTAAILGANTFTALQTLSTGADIASATAVDLTAATGNAVVITGTTTSTSLTMTAGQQMILLPSGAWPLTFHATTMNINGGVSYTCAAGDRVYVVKDLANVIRVSVTKQDGTSVVAAGGGSLILLETVNASGASTVDMETTFDSTYDAYEIVVSGFVCGTDNQQVGIRFKIGGAYLTTGYAHHLTYVRSNTGNYLGSANTNDNRAPMALSQGNVGGESGNFRIYIYKPTATGIQHVVNYHGGYMDDGAVTYSITGASSNPTTGALTGIQVLPYSGTCTCAVRLYGLANS